MAHVALTAVGVDRPGIVAAVTEVLKDEGCNLEDTSMTILRGHFAMMLVVAVPPEARPADLEAALAPVAERLHLVVTVRTIDETERGGTAGDPWAVAVYGADRPGIVHAVTSVLADAGVNVVDLKTRVIGDADSPVYAMLLAVSVPRAVDTDALAARLGSLSGTLGVDCTMHRTDADVL